MVYDKTGYNRPYKTCKTLFFFEVTGGGDPLLIICTSPSTRATARVSI